MIINFYKYQGTGNDFIIIDIRNLNYNFKKQEISKLCDRKFGVGADGVMLIDTHKEYDFEMQFYNPDGSMSFCGNGSRCAVLFCFHNNLCTRKTKFLTNDGVHFAEIVDAENIKIDMVSPIKVNKLKNGDFQTNTGSPHYVQFTKEFNDSSFIENCKLIRFSEEYFEDGINVNMVIDLDNEINVRTYERGVENETLSCGSGVTAAALSFASYKDSSSPIVVHTKGGELNVDFDKKNGHFENVYLTGSAHFVFRGEFDL
jgi:diaminopimelate epimerase